MKKDLKLHELEKASEHITPVLIMKIFYYLYRRTKRVMRSLVGVSLDEGPDETKLVSNKLELILLVISIEKEIVLRK